MSSSKKGVTKQRLTKKKARAKLTKGKASVEKASARARAPAKLKSSATAETALAKISALCLALPDTKLTMTWGSPHFRVGDKIFCGFGSEGGQLSLGVKLQMSHAQSVVKEARFRPSPYVGKHGWVSLDVTQRKSWDEVAALIRESYGLIAPKSALAKLR